MPIRADSIIATVREQEALYGQPQETSTAPEYDRISPARAQETMW
jgi:hypothetical protein